MTGFKLLIGGGRSSGKSSLINFLTSGILSSPFPRGVKGRLSKLNSIQFNQVESSEDLGADSCRIKLSIGCDEKAKFDIAAPSDKYKPIMHATVHDLILHFVHSQQVHAGHASLSLCICSTKAPQFASIIELGESILEAFIETGRIEHEGADLDLYPDAYVHITSAIKPLAFIERQAIKKFQSLGVPVLLLVNKCDLVDDADSLEDVIRFVEAFCAVDDGSLLPHYFSAFGKSSEGGLNLTDISKVALEIQRFCEDKSSLHPYRCAGDLLEMSFPHSSSADTDDIYKAVSEIAGLTTRDESVVAMILKCIGNGRDARAAALIRMHKPHPDIAKTRIISAIMERDKDLIQSYAKEIAAKYGLVEKVLIQQIGRRGREAVIHAIERDISEGSRLNSKDRILRGPGIDESIPPDELGVDETVKADLSRVSLLATYTKHQSEGRAPKPSWQIAGELRDFKDRSVFAPRVQMHIGEQERSGFKAQDDHIEEQEFSQLIEEMRDLEFTCSSEVSAYIRKHRLGSKYKHISGRLVMEKDGESWEFDGGFPPHIYARLCEELNLANKSSRAQPIKFTPYKDIL